MSRRPVVHTERKCSKRPLRVGFGLFAGDGEALSKAYYRASYPLAPIRSCENRFPPAMDRLNRCAKGCELPFFVFGS